MFTLKEMRSSTPPPPTERQRKSVHTQIHPPLPTYSHSVETPPAVRTHSSSVETPPAVRTHSSSVGRATAVHTPSPSSPSSLPSQSDSVTLRGVQPPTVELVTSIGSVEIELYWLHAPRCCRNFVELSKAGYYDGCPIHRVVRNFCIQTGDPSGTGRGGTSIYGDTFNDEIHPELRHTGAGIVSMANYGPNTNSSQFFITLAPTPFLDGKNSIFGRVCTGMEVVRKMSNLQTTATDRPVLDIKIIRASTAIKEDTEDAII